MAPKGKFCSTLKILRFAFWK